MTITIEGTEIYIYVYMERNLAIHIFIYIYVYESGANLLCSLEIVLFLLNEVVQDELVNHG